MSDTRKVAGSHLEVSHMNKLGSDGLESMSDIVPKIGGPFCFPTNSLQIMVAQVIVATNGET